MSIDQYISCYDNCTLRHVESLAMIGLVRDFYEVDCEKPRFKKIVVELFNGKKVTSMCYLDEEIKQSIKIIKIYVEIAKRNESIGKLHVIDSTESIDRD